jgi:CBS domain-containing protein/PII-like signaling protein
MTSGDSIQRVRIYLGERDQRGGEPLYLLVLTLLRNEGATGATVLRGLAGFGPGFWMRAARPGQMTDRPPVVVEWVDRAERIAQTLPKLDELVPNALITLETVQVYRAVLRQRGPFAGEATAGTIMHPLAVTVTPETPLSEAFALMIAQRLSSVPVINAEEQLLGMLLERDFAYRARLNIPLALIELLDQQARDALLTPLVGRTVAELMTGEPRSVSKGTAIPQALVLMIEQGYDQIAVLDRDGRVVGMLGSDDALRASLEANTNATQGVRDAEPPTPVNLVMQTNSASIRIDQAPVAALELLLQAPQRQFAVVETDGRLIGVLTLEQVLRKLSPADLAIFSMALVRGDTGAATRLNITTLQEVIEQEPQTLAPTDTVFEATRRLLEGGLASAPVVDTEGRFVGTLTRGSLVRALIQQSE